jgi:hypothetical protein
VDRIEPRAVEALIGIAIDYVRQVDDGAAGGGFGAAGGGFSAAGGGFSAPSPR